MPPLTMLFSQAQFMNPVMASECQLKKITCGLSQAQSAATAVLQIWTPTVDVVVNNG